jgi:Chondroitinase B
MLFCTLAIMKKILLLVVWQCVFLTYAFSSEVTCLSRTYYVNDLISLNEKITFLVNDAATYSTTIMLLNGTYVSNTAQALFRDINPQGPCPCTILAETDYGVTLKGRLLWRSYSAKNLTIRGINFIKTRFAGASPIVEFSIASSNNKIMNCTFSESVSSIPSGTNYYIQMHGGQNNTIENCEFKTKKSLGHYINMAETRNNKIINSTFSEVNDDDDIKYYLLLRDNSKATIKECTFRDKFSEGHYIGLNFDSATLFDSNSFSETNFMHPDAGVDFTVDSAKYYIDIHMADKCRVAGNTFHNKLSIGHAIDVSDYDSNPGKNHHVIVDNNFNSMYLRAPQSFIKVGHCGDNTTTAELNAGIIIQGNLFRRYNYNNYGYNEIISNKSSGNSYLFNTFEECNGTLFLRCGNSITVEGNRFLGTHQPQEGGLGICGANHKIYNNHFEELGNFALMLIAGNTIPSNQDNCYPNVENSFLSFNTIVNCNGIYILTNMLIIKTLVLISSCQ